MNIEILEAQLPNEFACYAMYGEHGDDIDGEAAFNNWLSDTMDREGYASMHCVSIEEGPSFMAHHELKDYGIGSADCSNFIFHVTKA